MHQLGYTRLCEAWSQFRWKHYVMVTNGANSQYIKRMPNILINRSINNEQQTSQVSHLFSAYSDKVKILSRWRFEYCYKRIKQNTKQFLAFLKPEVDCLSAGYKNRLQLGWRCLNPK